MICWKNYILILNNNKMILIISKDNKKKKNNNSNNNSKNSSNNNNNNIYNNNRYKNNDKKKKKQNNTGFKLRDCKNYDPGRSSSFYLQVQRLYAINKSYMLLKHAISSLNSLKRFVIIPIINMSSSDHITKEKLFCFK